MQLTEGTFAVAFAGATAFSATIPLGPARQVPAIVRVALALSITPMAAHAGAFDGSTGEIAMHACTAAAAGASVGMTASIIAGTAGSAGALIDNALTGGPGNASDSSGRGGGAFTLLLPLVLANALCGSGALAWLIAEFATFAARVAIHVTAESSTALSRAAFDAAIILALPPLLAHALATLVAGITARVAPRINGMLLAPALGSPFTLLVVLAGVPAMFALMRHVAAGAVHAALHL